MTVQRPVAAFDDTDWEVPEHGTALYAAKRHAHALVIPVINEGERIRGQLTRIREAGLPVDVIVADGGSTDGSLDPDFVEPAGVRAVLNKTGPGKLSAQLRMAYAWCLRQGYDGIVTIDGNGKDGVEAVADMVARLEAGYDYVQGSRYLPGGEAENTPLERTIANRLIHAPLLSIAGRHVFTDTTNGFRAYSARYLTHPEVQPFRTEFEVYNLLFYLTVRAGQLGLKVGHVPVIRRYPDNGKVPTKIGGLASKLALLGETVTAVTGGYTPDEAGPKMASMWWPALAILLVLAPLLLSVVVAPQFSPDSWAFYELSKTVFGDFYAFSHWRSYGSEVPYSSAFPPLWPVFIAIADAVLGTGARTGLYLAFAAFFAFALVSEQIGRRVVGAAWVGSAMALILLLGPKMVWTEMEAGRTIPLQLLLYSLALLGLLGGRGITIARAGAIGLIAGLAVLNRFDAVLLVPAAALFVAFLTRSPVRAIVSLAASLLTVSPWIAYSLTTFGTLFATDNSGIAFSLDPQAFVTDWWPEPQPSLMDNPAAWTTKVTGNLGTFFYNGAALVASPMAFVFAAAIAVLGPFYYVGSKAPQHSSDKEPHARGVWTVAGFAALTACLMLPQLLTGYFEYRYYSAMFWSAFLTASLWLIAKGITRHQCETFARVVALVCGIAVSGFAALQLSGAYQSGRLDLSQWTSLEAPGDVQKLTECLGDDQSARVLVLGDDLFAARTGALGGMAAMMEPRNLADGRLGPAGASRFIANWQVDYIFAADPGRLTHYKTVRLESVRQCPGALFKVAED